ncbi:MAG: hypothetical protein ABI585_08155 [Betaproteobacteria bacterium]
MEWFYLESLAALAIAVGIVWWTVAPLRARRRREREQREAHDSADRR